MNRNTAFALFFCFVLAAANGLQAAPFANLDFESASPPGDPLPSWTVNNLGPIYNLACLGSSCVSVHDAGSGSLSPSTPIAGDFSVFLQGGTSGNSGELPLIGAEIAQTGDVPVGTQSIRLLSTVAGAPDPLISSENVRVSLDGNDIPLVTLDVTGDIVTLGGDVSSFAGSTVDLVVGTVTPEANGPELWAWVDSISFSTEAIPEPSSAVLLIVAVLLVRKRR